MRLILVSHGLFAKELLESAELIVGKIPGACAYGLTPEMGPADLQKKLEVELKKSSPEQEVLLALDLLGGTPSNVAVQLLSQFPQIEIVTGINLPMVIEFSNQQLLGDKLDLNQLLSMGVQGITNVKEKVAADDDEDET
ncbi:mannose/fructose/sorbose-specific PTS system IIA component [Ligilactobacillus salitolerans]|uniref:Mannose/fructose/sorbose-specific PTS system IIA component n=1 Tax=Ligilactobacillus salitolerans TaxID=1808352 RepID=A0A401IUI6_9LACO|nr:PTS sugar transporter subunit IIA [Ligilactobacillus salitolerans]GBG95158.1 mannose/fructose/sorbose-specific PTS system IIA component [Ligilactobacillus salitolerans]